MIVDQKKVAALPVPVESTGICTSAARADKKKAGGLLLPTSTGWTLTRRRPACGLARPFFFVPQKLMRE